MAKYITLVIDIYECILCARLYSIIQSQEENNGCPNCGGPSNYLDTVEVNLV